MTHKPRSIGMPAIIIAYLAVSAILIGAAYQLSLRTGLDQLEHSGDIVLEQAADRLIAQLESYREQADFLARHPQISALLNGQTKVERTSEFLLRTALTTGAKEIHTLDFTGRVLASSTYEDTPEFIGTDLSKRPDIIAAATGRMGVFHTADSNGKRSYYFARGVLAGAKQPRGFVVVKVDMDELEAEWRIDETVVTFIDDAGVVFVSNRLGLTLTYDDARAQIKPSALTYTTENLMPFPAHITAQSGGRVVAHFPKTGIIPRHAKIISRDIPLIDMSAHAFMDLQPTISVARLLAALTAALLSLFGLGFAIFLQSRARLADQLHLEEKANTRLEARVATRTMQLQQSQDNLIQASKLTALGQMSAGISHELNQPLSAIQNYAESSKKLIDRGREPEALENLTMISEQTVRMSRIIHNLRGFSRKETEPLDQVNFATVLSASLDLAAQRAKSEGITIRAKFEPDIWVEAGQVRLQQVIVNLLSNAMDAMTDTPNKEIDAVLSQQRGQVQLVITDTGPGLADIERAFEPFYTTKDIGASKGLGLGLSISYGIIGSFNGLLSVENLTDGGAAFTITLPAITPQEQPS